MSPVRTSLHLQVNISEPIYSMWGQVLLYRQFGSNIYKKFLVDMVEDGCGWLNSTASSYFLDHTLGKLINHFNTNTNIDHKCPYEGHVYLENDDISMDYFTTEHLLPSGKYKLEIIGSTDIDGKWVVAGKVYFTISDNSLDEF